MRPKKYDEVARALEAQILSGALQPGEVLPSQSRLCERHGISRSCAQKALDELLGKGLIESQPGKGVYVKGAREPEERKPRFKNVAVLFHQEFRLEANEADNFGLEMLWGVEEELRNFGANCIIRKRGRNESFESSVPELEAIGADAFILDREFDDLQLRPLRALGVPLAMLGRLCSLPYVSSALPNHGDCFLQSFLRMADEGRRSVALIQQGGHYYDPELKWAFERAAALRPECEFLRAELRCSFGTQEGGVPGALAELERDGKLPETLVFSNDWQALKALELLEARGLKVPGDCETLGCFDIALSARSKPKLSSMRVDPRELGRRAVRLLAGSALEGLPPRVEKAPFILAERESFRWKTH